MTVHFLHAAKRLYHTLPRVDALALLANQYQTQGAAFLPRTLVDPICKALNTYRAYEKLFKGPDETIAIRGRQIEGLPSTDPLSPHLLQLVRLKQKIIGRTHDKDLFLLSFIIRNTDTVVPPHRDTYPTNLIFTLKEESVLGWENNIYLQSKPSRAFNFLQPESLLKIGTIGQHMSRNGVLVNNLRVFHDGTTKLQKNGVRVILNLEWVPD